jgi:hypothetical protein
MTSRDRLFAICCLSVVFVLAAVPAKPGAPPQCPPPTPSLLGITYSGAITGCSNGPGGNANCVVGETIQFKVGSGQDACNTSYIWQFEDGPVNGSATFNHQFPAPGSYSVMVSIYDSPTPRILTQVVTVVSASAVPTFGAPAGAFLFLLIALLALYRLR